MPKKMPAMSAFMLLTSMCLFLAIVLTPATGSGLAQNPFVVIDDMWFWPEQLVAPTTASRRQAFPVDPQLSFGAWDSGVVPYQIAAEFPAVERQNILDAFAKWSQVAPIVFVERTTQTGYLNITRDNSLPDQATGCFSNIGQFRMGVVVRTNYGDNCAQRVHAVAHELGHALGFRHEHQRGDRDDYVTVDLANVQENALANFNLLPNAPLVGPYDFGSIMHYPRGNFAIDPSRPTIIPRAPYSSWLLTMGTLPDPSVRDHEAMAFLYNSQLRDSDLRAPTEPPRSRFDRTEFLLAMERLHAFYMSRFGLQRPQGLSIGGRPDFAGIATWIFDVFLPARASGFSAEGAFDIVRATITRSEEWRQKNPARAPLTPADFARPLAFGREEFLDVLSRLDRFYAAPEGLQRPEGLSIAGGPDFLGIATWVFDVYLNQRLAGASPNAAWVLTENAIRSTDEWRRKH